MTMGNALVLDDRKRALVEARIMERLGRLDDSTLRELDLWLAKPVTGESQSGKRRAMTRRQALSMLLLGGAAAAGTGVAGSYLGQSGVLEESAERISGLNAAVDDWQNRAEALGGRFQDAQELIGMFDQLEGVGLDDVVQAGIGAVAGALGGVAQAAQTLREGLIVARNNINQLDEGLAVLDNGLAGVEGAVSRLSGLMQGLEDRLQAAGEPVAPLTEALGGFFTGLISRIPGVGPRIVEAIERVQAVISAIPESIENINRDLIEPLRQRFFPREGEDVHVRLLEPLTGLIFSPAEGMLGSLANLATTWQTTMEAPAKEKVLARSEVRKQIEAFRVEKQL